MFNISSFLQKFSKQLDSIQLHTQEICDILQKHTGLLIHKSHVEIKNYSIYLDISPTLKNKVFVYKKAILKDIEHQFSEKIIDIK